MNGEIAKRETPEIKNSEVQNFREIKPETGLSVESADKYWNSVFSNTENKISDNDNTEEQIDKNDLGDTDTGLYDGGKLKPNDTIEKDGYIYKTDSKGRVISAEGQLHIKAHLGRDDIQPSREKVGRGEMKDSDQRGHLIADRFDGSNKLENIVPMDAKLNQGDYKKLENTLAKAVESGADVRMKVEPKYEGNSTRPNEFKVSYTINGEKNVVVFQNGSDK